MVHISERLTYDGGRFCRRYIREFCGDSCWAGPEGGPVLTLAEFVADVRIFDLNMVPYDGQATLGPWQTMTAVPSTDSLELRISEAIGYVESCCMDGEITNPAEPGSRALWCEQVSGSANCPNTVNGLCPLNPNRPGGGFPISTIQVSALSPPLTWCGCMKEGGATTGYSGRCSHSRDDFYTR